MENTETRCYTYFRIAGEFDPDVISEMLGLEAERSWRIGDVRINGTVHNIAEWDFGFCREYDVETDVQMRRTVEPLLSKTEILREIKRRFDAVFYLEVVPTVVCGDTVPCLAPSIDVMKFCCETGTELDIDLYLEKGE